MSRATYKSPAQLVRLKKTLLLNSQNFCNWNALQLTAPSGAGQESFQNPWRFFFFLKFLQLFPWIWEEAKAFQSFYKTNKQNQIPSPPSQWEEHPGWANRPLTKCFPDGERFLAFPFFHIPGVQRGLNSNICCSRVQILLGENFMVRAYWNCFQRQFNQDGCVPMKSLTFSVSAVFTKQC